MKILSRVFPEGGGDVCTQAIRTVCQNWTRKENSSTPVPVFIPTAQSWSDGKDNVARNSLEIKCVSTCRVFCFANKKPIAVFSRVSRLPSATAPSRNSIKAISSSKFSSLELVGLQHFVGKKKEILKNSWRSRKCKNHFTFLSRTSQNRLTEECNKKQPLFSCNFICHAVACCHCTSKFRGFQCSCILLAGVCAREKRPIFHAIFSHIDSSSYKTNVHNKKNGDVSLFCTLCKQQNVRLLQTFEVLINFCYAISL